MDYTAEERRGRGLLAALAVLNLVMDALFSLSAYLWGGGLSLEWALGLLTRLLPALVLYGALLRGSWPALVLLCIQLVIRAGDLIGALQFGGVSSLNSGTALSFLSLLARGTLLLAVWQHSGAARYLMRRRERRRRSDLVWEIVLYIVAFVVYLVINLAFLAALVPTSFTFTTGV